MASSQLVLNGQKLAFSSGQTLLEVARSNHIHIPTLCYPKGATPTGACRICVVEVEGSRTLPAACSTPASENMIVHTHSPRVIQARKMILELMLSSGNHNCAAAGATDLESRETSSR
ncbi:MAG: 2Fe-2S iron-sulfur cluster-binding protein [Desulfobacteraceae bacterium]|jgi:NADH dehydrogenase/NADH:ubiquinone oxidoreductase subunit G